ncbi:MAG: 50S ribosomal protein L21, partial [Oscillospiraceae bacterium]
MKAVFITGGKQYAVCEGDVVYIEKLDAQADEVVTFEEVLFVGEGEEAKFGAPVVAGAKVEAKVVKNGKGKKLNIITYKAKKSSSRKMGHRQP